MKFLRCLIVALLCSLPASAAGWLPLAKPFGYLYFATLSTSVSVPAAKQLLVLNSTDLKAFSTTARSTCVSATENTVTPAALFLNNKLWLMTNPNNLFGVGAQTLALSLWSVSLSGLNCAAAPTHVDFSGVIGTGASAAVWPGSWFISQAGNLYTFNGASADQSADTGFAVYRTKATNNLDPSQGFGTPVAVTGTSLPANVIDPFVFQIGSTVYCLCKNETTKFVELWSTSDTEGLTGWAVIGSGDWAGWGSNMEAPQLTVLPNGTYHVLLDHSGAGIFWTEATTITGPWSAPVAITSAQTMQHGSVIPIPAGYSVGTPATDVALRLPGSTTAGMYETLATGLQADGLWSSLDVAYGLAADTQANGLINLTNNAFPITAHGSPTFTANVGLTGTGVNTTFLDTTFAPGTPGGGNYTTPNYVLNGASFGVCITNSRATGAAYAEMGSQDGTGSNLAASDIFPWYTDNNFYGEVNANDTGTATSTNVQGIWVLSRTAASGAGAVSVYHNNVLVRSVTTTSVISAINTFYLLATHTSAPVTGPSADSLGFAFVGGPLNSTKATSMYNRIHALGISGC